MTETPVRVTPSAFRQLSKVLASKGSRQALRVAVLGGGCSGFQYTFELDDPAADDLVLSDGETQVIIDPMSLPLLAGSQIDYKQELIGARFAVDNPNAQSTCGCGTSFSI